MSEEKREVGTPQWLREVAHRNIEGRINTSPYDLLQIAYDWEASLKAAVEAEREACARVCAEWGMAHDETWCARQISNAIRARSEQ